MKLEIKHLAPYLPYGLKGVLISDMSEDFPDDVDIDFSKGSIWNYCGFVEDDIDIPLGEGEISGLFIRKGNFYTSVGKHVKPLLYPLSHCITISKEYLRTSTIHSQLYQCHTLSVRDLEFAHFKTIKILIQNKIDFQGLIEEGLAIDATKLDKNPYEYNTEQPR